MYSLTVVVPFYNEESFLSESLRRLLETDVFDEILLVDDSSTDKSSNIGKEFEANNQKIRYFRTSQNNGKGSALGLAFSHIKSTHVVIHDADLEYFPIDIVDMKEESMKNPDSLILGSRFIGKKDRTNIYLRTFIANKVMSLFFSVVNFYRISDVATCYKLMPKNFVEKIELKEKGFSIEIEMLTKFLKYNRSVFEIPISYSGRSYDEGKKIKTSDGFLYLFNTLKYRFIN